jgi:CRP/FNR family cyclic AMP-dependent transcriptional regulator
MADRDRNLGPDARAFLETNSITANYTRGSVFFREGALSNAVFVVCSGKAKVSATYYENRKTPERLRLV